MNGILFKSLKKISAIFCFSFLLIGSQGCYALPFSIVTKAGTTLPTALSPSCTSTTAFYTITNETASQRNNNYIKYLPPGVTQVTTGGTYSDTCGATFNLTPNGQTGDSCTLQLTISQGVNANDPNPHHHLFACFPSGLTCAGTNDPLNVTEVNITELRSISVTPTTATLRVSGTQQYIATGIYVGNLTSDLTSCVIWNSDNPGVAGIATGGATSGLATAAATGTTHITATLIVTSNAALLTVTGFIYVGNAGTSDITYCSLNVDGSINAASCAVTVTTTTQPVSIVISPDNTVAYITVNQAVPLYCTINSDGSLSNCFQTGTGSLSPTGMALYADSEAYLTNFNDNNLSYCPIFPDGSFSCNTVDFSAPVTSISGPVGIALLGSTQAYVVSNLSNVVYLCTISAGGSIYTCGNTPTTGFNSPEGITLNSVNSFAYIANTGSNQVIYCSGVGGALTGCTADANTFFAPVAIAINTAGTSAYIANDSLAHSVISTCTMNGGGPFVGTCTTTSGFSSPAAVAVLH